jgi:YHS domain-containing protein
MKSAFVVALLSVASLLAVSALVANDATDAEKVDLTKIKCVVSGKAINPAATVEYKEALVYFCCEGCPKAFAENTKKFEAKANHQLVATRQAKQATCPLSGKELNPETGIEIAGVEVTFCCNNCKKAASGKEGDEQLELVFGEKPFEKGFKIAEKTETIEAK